MGTLNNETTKSQNKAIRSHLLRFGEIDKKTAIAICDSERLGARIWDIRHDEDLPLDIETVRVTKKNRFGHPTTYAVYRLRKEV